MESQLRQDLVSGDWIVIAPSRAKRLGKLLARNKRPIPSPKAECPFEDPQASGNDKPILLYGDSKKWRIQIVQNKYPALTHLQRCAEVLPDGPYSVMEGVGHHDLVITRDHLKHFPKLTPSEAQQVFEAFRDRYLMFLEDRCIAYVSIFHNWGPKAGASVYHPHYQIIAVPIIPPDILHSLRGSERYFSEHKRCVHCVMIENEVKEKVRVIYENKHAIAVAPFVSRNPFEVRVFPKAHSPYFENTTGDVFAGVAAATQAVLKKIEKNLHYPDYNFFIHTAPIQDRDHYSMYHWHLEILPKITIQAGFELGTGIDINVVDPDEAAVILRK